MLIEESASKSEVMPAPVSHIDHEHVFICGRHESRRAQTGLQFPVRDPTMNGDALEVGQLLGLGACKLVESV